MDQRRRDEPHLRVLNRPGYLRMWSTAHCAFLTSSPPGGMLATALEGSIFRGRREKTIPTGSYLLLVKGSAYRALITPDY